MLDEEYHPVCGNVGKQQESMHLKYINVHFELRWEMVPPTNALCAMIYHSRSSEGKVQWTPSFIVLVKEESKADRKLIHLVFSLQSV